MKNLFLALFLLSLFSCKGTKETRNIETPKEKLTENTTKKTMASYKEIANDKLGEGVEFFMNENESMVLCKKTVFSKHIPMGKAGSNNLSGNAANIKLIVINVEKGNILYEKSIAYGSAEWENDTQLRIMEIMGANSANNPNLYLYHVLTGVKTQLNNGRGGSKIEKY
ncbi:MAG: hypothetical protein ACI81T_004210 [Bacteroidia bacterium]|jgi:hypothetical protein